VSQIFCGDKFYSSNFDIVPYVSVDSYTTYKGYGHEFSVGDEVLSKCGNGWRKAKITAIDSSGLVNVSLDDRGWDAACGHLFKSFRNISAYEIPEVESIALASESDEMIQEVIQVNCDNCSFNASVLNDPQSIKRTSPEIDGFNLDLEEQSVQPLAI